jgi:hypothetical protein
MKKYSKNIIISLLTIFCLLVYIISNAKKISFLDKLKSKNQEQYINYLKSISVVSKVDFKLVENTSFRQYILKLNFNKHIDIDININNNNNNKYILYELRKKHILNLEWIIDNKKDLFNKIFSKIHSQSKIN